LSRLSANVDAGLSRLSAKLDAIPAPAAAPTSPVAAPTDSNVRDVLPAPQAIDLCSPDLVDMDQASPTQPKQKMSKRQTKEEKQRSSNVKVCVCVLLC
jgi:hypothetical protein